MFETAKGIMEIALGPQHVDTIETIQSLAMGSYDLAIGFQRQVIEALENHGSSAMNELREARRHLADRERRGIEPEWNTAS
ncbi:hypothetical protein SUGI_0882760 [Cryptomeria japonica]|nr:hypothetical protein SUGI_0882760 [Cryptomeria japonica]